MTPFVPVSLYVGGDIDQKAEEMHLILVVQQCCCACEPERRL